MRMLIIANLVSPWSVALCRELARQGIELVIIGVDYRDDAGSYLLAGDKALNPELGELLALANVEMESVSVGNGAWEKLVSAPRQVRAISRRHRPDAAMCLYGGLLGVFLMASGVAVRVPYLVGSDVLGGGILRRWLNYLLVRTSACVLCNGENLTREVRSILDDPKIQRLYIGLDPEPFDAATVSSKPARIICTRGFAPLYNNDFIIEALAQVDLDELGVEFDFVSKGPDLQKSMTLADSILSETNRQRVRFHGGVKRDLFVELLLSSDVYVSTSLSDGSSVSLWEAMLCNAWPVLSDIPANREWAGDEHATLVKLGDVSGLADSFRKVIKGYGALKEKLEDNRARVLETANIKRTVARVNDIIAELLREA